ncbi:T9SS type A sorting domain-containing protein [Chitinophagaceae bacterium MMS25-I14]
MIPHASGAQTWSTVWSENFNNATYESCYTSGGSTYWANCANPPSGPRNSLINGAWEVSNTALAATQSPSNAAGGRFLMYWSDQSYQSSVPAADSVIFKKVISGLTVGRKYRISYKQGGLLQLPATTLLSPASIKLRLNNTQVIPAATVTTSWQSQSYTWTANATTMTLEWVNNVKATAGNDFALDDLLVEVSTSTLPVTLTGFSASPEAGCTVQVQWSTATETDFSHFELERSADGSHYGQIATIAAKGQNSNYLFTDAVPLDGTSVYRLKIIDKDNSYEYSKIAAVSNACERALHVQVYPVPATRVVSVKGIPAGAKIVVCNAAGQLVAVKEAAAEAEDIDIQHYAAGVYLVKVYNSSTLWTGRIVKQ